MSAASKKRLSICPSTRSGGLDEAEVRRRRGEHGRNRLGEAERVSPWKILADQFRNLVIGILAVAAIVSFAMGEIVQMAAILAAIVINAVIGFVTEWKAVRSMEALRSLGTVQARVTRDGSSATVDSEELVPGDVVLLDAGNVVTADLRLIEANGLTCDESSLTGESVPVTKTTEEVEADAPLAERTSMAFKGTAVTGGSGAGVVVATGMQTELGDIARMTSEASEEVTPLEKAAGPTGAQSGDGHVDRGGGSRRPRLAGREGPRVHARDGGGACGGRRAGGSADRRYGRAGARHVAYGAAQRAGRTAGRGRNAGLNQRDLRRQDRNADAEPDARGAAGASRQRRGRVLGRGQASRRALALGVPAA